MRLKISMKQAIDMTSTVKYAKVMLRLRKQYKYLKNMIVSISKILTLMQLSSTKLRLDMISLLNITKNQIHI